MAKPSPRRRREPPTPAATASSPLSNATTNRTSSGVFRFSFPRRIIKLVLSALVLLLTFFLGYHVDRMWGVRDSPACPACPGTPPPTTCPTCPEIPPPPIYCPAASTNFTPPEAVSRVDNEEDDYDGVYHSWDAFKKNYAEMEKSFKVYIYPDGDPNTYYHTPKKLTGKYASEGYFFHHIRSSHFLTKNPKHADMFFIPISCHKMRGKGISYTNMTLMVQNYVERLILKYPYWNRTLGMDHFFVTCLDIGVKATEGIPFLAKNAVRIVCASSADLGFIPRKDISLPQILLPRLLSAGDASEDRTNLAFWAGVWNHPIRKKLVKTWKNDPELDVANYPRDIIRGNKSIYRKFYRNKFCICPRHYMPNTVRIADAIHYGCIPVIISDHYVPPFSSILDWRQFSIKIKEEEISNLKRLLKGTNDSYYALMHRNLVKVQKHFQWNTPAVKYDAFHMTMYELWRLRPL